MCGLVSTKRIKGFILSIPSWTVPAVSLLKQDREIIQSKLQTLSCYSHNDHAVYSKWPMNPCLRN